MVTQLIEDTAYQAKDYGRGLLSGSVKGIFHLITGSGIGALAAGKYGTTGAATLGAELLAFGGIGVGFFVNGYRYHKKYEDKQHQMLSMYGEEISAYLGKEKGGLTIDDLHKVAEKVPALGREIQLDKRRRNVNTYAWTLASAASYATVFYAVLPVVAPMMAATVVPFIAMGMAVITSKILEYPAEALCHKLAKTNERTGHDHVNELSRMRNTSITPEKVMGVFVATNPNLAESIEQKSGRSYHTMPREEQQAVLNDFYLSQEVYQLTDQLRQGLIQPTELAWKASAQDSGVQPLVAPLKTRGERIEAKVRAGVSQGIDRTKDLVETAKEKGLRGLANEVRTNGLLGQSEDGHEGGREGGFVDRYAPNGGGERRESWSEAATQKRSGAAALTT